MDLVCLVSFNVDVSFSALLENLGIELMGMDCFYILVCRYRIIDIDIGLHVGFILPLNGSYNTELWIIIPMNHIHTSTSENRFDAVSLFLLPL